MACSSPYRPSWARGSRVVTRLPSLREDARERPSTAPAAPTAPAASWDLLDEDAQDPDDDPQDDPQDEPESDPEADPEGDTESDPESDPEVAGSSTQLEGDQDFEKELEQKHSQGSVKVN